MKLTQLYSGFYVLNYGFGKVHQTLEKEFLNISKNIEYKITHLTQVCNYLNNIELITAPH